MHSTLRIAIIGDYDPVRPSHIATEAALGHAAEAVSAKLDAVWLPTEKIKDLPGGDDLKRFHGFLCAPGSPYKSLSGAMTGIRFCRLGDRPFLGT